MSLFLVLLVALAAPSAGQEGSCAQEGRLAVVDAGHGECAGGEGHLCHRSAGFDVSWTLRPHLQDARIFVAIDEGCGAE